MEAKKLKRAMKRIAEAKRAARVIMGNRVVHPVDDPLPPDPAWADHDPHCWDLRIDVYEVRLVAEDGTELKTYIQMVDMDPDDAARYFDRGQNVGDSWKHRIWTINTGDRDWDYEELVNTVNATRYHYGWANGSEKLTVNDNGYTYEARYVCY